MKENVSKIYQVPPNLPGVHIWYWIIKRELFLQPEWVWALLWCSVCCKQTLQREREWDRRKRLFGIVPKNQNNTREPWVTTKQCVSVYQWVPVPTVWNHWEKRKHAGSLWLQPRSPGYKCLPVPENRQQQELQEPQSGSCSAADKSGTDGGPEAVWETLAATNDTNETQLFWRDKRAERSFRDTPTQRSVSPSLRASWDPFSVSSVSEPVTRWKREECRLTHWQWFLSPIMHLWCHGKNESTQRLLECCFLR